MNVLRIMMVAGVVMVCGSSVRSAVNPPGTTRPATVAENFLKGMEEMLVLESQGKQKQATEVKNRLAGMISDETVNDEVAPFGKSVANLSAEAILNIQTGMVTAWGALVNYYHGSIDYSQIDTMIPMLQAAQKDSAHIAIGTLGPDKTHRVRIVVFCVQENSQWKIKQVRLAPLRKTTTHPASTQPKK